MLRLTIRRRSYSVMIGKKRRLKFLFSLAMFDSAWYAPMCRQSGNAEVSKVSPPRLAVAIIVACSIVWPRPWVGHSEAQPLTLLEDAIRDGKVSSQITGVGGSTGDTIEVTLQRKVPQTLSLTLAPGTVLKSVDPSVQDMIVARIKGKRTRSNPGRYEVNSEIVLSDDNPHSYVIEAYCLDFHKANPGPTSSFTLERPDAHAEQIVKAGLASGAAMAVTQGALWIERAKADDSQLKARFPFSDRDLLAARELLKTSQVNSPGQSSVSSEQPKGVGPKPGFGQAEGRVFLDGIVQPNVLVVLNRTADYCVAEFRTDETGKWSIPSIEPDYYFVTSYCEGPRADGATRLLNFLGHDGSYLVRSGKLTRFPLFQWKSGRSYINSREDPFGPQGRR